MDIQISPEEAPPIVQAKGSARAVSPATGWTIGLFVIFWLGFYALHTGLPYLTNGSDIIDQAKIHMEEHGQIFPADPAVTRVMIFGDSKVMAGFMPRQFDRMAAGRGWRVSSFNAGLPGTDVFLPQLKAIAGNGQAPDILLLTLPWTDPPGEDAFHLVREDHRVIHALFPFRFWLRDATAFLMNAHRYGGIHAGYREAEHNQRLVQVDRGYYLIEEQSHFPSGRLPSQFRLPTDTPRKMKLRVAPPVDSQTRELSRLVTRYHMRCLYVPQYYRMGEFAAPHPINAAFAASIQQATPCHVVGPDYFLYPSGDFSDQTHVNGDGARLYTAAIFHLIEDKLSLGKETLDALQ